MIKLFLNFLCLVLPLLVRAQFNTQIQQTDPHIVLSPETSGLDFLREDSILNVVYNYDNLYVGRITEQEYLERRVKDESDHQWFVRWIGNRPLLFQPAFEGTLNKRLKKKKVKFFVRQKKANAKYTMVVKTKSIEPGFWAYKVSESSDVEIDFIFFKSSDPDKVIAMVHGKNFRGFSVEPGTRIANAYARAGWLLGDYLKEYVFIKK
jgi:hypothetical protein